MESELIEPDASGRMWNKTMWKLCQMSRGEQDETRAQKDDRMRFQAVMRLCLGSQEVREFSSFREKVQHWQLGRERRTSRAPWVGPVAIAHRC